MKLPLYSFLFLLVFEIIIELYHFPFPNNANVDEGKHKRPQSCNPALRTPGN